MKTRFAFAALCVPVTLSAPAFDVIEAKATQGTQLKKTFGEESSWSLTDMTQTIGGQDVPEDLPDIGGEARRETVVVDTYREWGAGKPQKLGRVFEEARAEVGVEISTADGDESYEYELTSPFVAQPMAFDWDADDEVYAVELEEGADGAALADLLEGLHEDMDLRTLLPSEKVAEGDSWSIDAGAFAAIVAPGGDLTLSIEGLPEGDYRYMQPLQLLAASQMSPGSVAQNIEGDAEATWEATSEEDGRRIAEIAITFDLTLIGAVQDSLLRLLEQAETEFPGSDLTFEVEWGFEGSADLRWDLAAGRFSTFQLEADNTISGSLNFSQDMGQAVEFQIDYDLEGKTRLEAEAEEVE